MTAEQLVAEGLVLMLVGMGTVFVFLTLLVLAVATMSRLLARLPDSVTTLESVAPRPQGGNAADDRTLVAVISAAVHRHRRTAGRPQRRR